MASFGAMVVYFFMLLSSSMFSCTLHMSMPNTYPKTFNVHMSKCLSFISTIGCEELGYIWT